MPSSNNKLIGICPNTVWREGQRRKKYREFVKGMIKKKGSMKGEMNRRRVYGSDNFIKEVAKEYKVEAVIKPKGRPKKEENKDK